jgi:hypothetical protein
LKTPVHFIPISYDTATPLWQPRADSPLHRPIPILVPGPVVVVGFFINQLLLVVLRLTIDNVSVYQHDNDDDFSYVKSGV